MASAVCCLYLTHVLSVSVSASAFVYWGRSQIHGQDPGMSSVRIPSISPRPQRSGGLASPHGIRDSALYVYSMCTPPPPPHPAPSDLELVPVFQFSRRRHNVKVNLNRRRAPVHRSHDTSPDPSPESRVESREESPTLRHSSRSAQATPQAACVCMRIPRIRFPRVWLDGPTERSRTQIPRWQRRTRL